jgi:ribosome modulation factor
MDDEFLEAGIRAFEAGTPREACPYPMHSQERELWLAGWDEARSVVEEENGGQRLTVIRPAAQKRPAT